MTKFLTVPKTGNDPNINGYLFRAVWDLNWKKSKFLSEGTKKQKYLNNKHDYVNYIIIIIFPKTFPHLNLFLSLLRFSIITSLTCTSANLQRSKIWRDFFQLALSVMFFSKTSFFFHCLYIVWSWSTFLFTSEQILNSRSKHKCKLWRRSTRWAFRNMWG